MHKILRRPGQKREKQKITKERQRVGPLKPKTRASKMYIRISLALERIKVFGYSHKKASLS